MGYRISGTYVLNCACAQICPCSVDGKPTGPNGECKGAGIFHIAKGNLDRQDLSGVTFALYNLFPSNITAGAWKIALIVDEAASDDQAKALERIITGAEGGLFGEFVPLVGEFTGTERAPVTFTAGAKPSGTIGRKSKLTFEPILAPDGTTVTVKGAPFGFAPEYRIGNSSGRTEGPFGTFEHVYGESANFEFSDVVPEKEPKGRI